MLVREFSISKSQIHFEEFDEIRKLIEDDAKNKGMSPTEWFRWLSYWYLGKVHLLKINIPKKNKTFLTAADLEMTEEQCNISMRRIELLNHKIVKSEIIK